MTQDQIQQIINKLDSLGSGAWEVYIRQARIELISNIFWILLGLAIFYITIKYWQLVKKEDDGQHMFTETIIGNGWLFIGCIVSIFADIFALVCISSVFEIPTLLFNPKYWAIQHILGSIK
jgi:hypothetical protein